jgi:hypothetical protein
MFARFENLPVADFRYRILFCGGVAPCPGSTRIEGRPHFPDLCAVHCASRFWDATPIDAARELAQGGLGIL